MEVNDHKKHFEQATEQNTDHCPYENIKAVDGDIGDGEWTPDEEVESEEKMD